VNNSSIVFSGLLYALESSIRLSSAVTSITAYMERLFKAVESPSKWALLKQL